MSNPDPGGHLYANTHRDAHYPLGTMKSSHKQYSNTPQSSTALISDEDTVNDGENNRISAYARLDFEGYTFFVQTLQVVLGRKSNHDMTLLGSRHAVDVHLSSKKAISRRHAKIFYNFGTQRFELLILGRNGAFVNKAFMEKGITVPLADSSKIQIGDITFKFVLPKHDSRGGNNKVAPIKPFNPLDAVNLRANLYNSKKHSPVKSRTKNSVNGNNKPAATALNAVPAALPIPLVKADDSIVIPSSAAQRRESILKMKRVLDIRRKSLASAASDEINGILRELGVDSIEAIDENNTQILDSQIQLILDGAGNDGNTNHPFAYDELAIEDEEDEIDRLTREHNLSQGVDLYQDTRLKDIDADLSRLDREISALLQQQPIISSDPATEARRKMLIQDRAAKQQERNEYFLSIPTLSTSFRKPSGLMGKPAAIQPPPNRIYGDGKAFSFEDRPYIRPPALKLLVPVLTMVPQPLVMRQRTPSRAITTSKEPSLFLFGVPKAAIEPLQLSQIGPDGRRRQRRESARVPKKVYSLDEIPDQYKVKPNFTQTQIVLGAFKANPLDRGLTLVEIYDAIKAVYPYYYFCPDGWQFGISRQVRFNKMFKRKEKLGNDWTYAIDDIYISEKEKMRQEQQEIAVQRSRDAAQRAEEFKQRAPLSMGMTGAHNYLGGRSSSIPATGGGAGVPQYVTGSSWSSHANGQRPKSIAELASEIKRDGRSLELTSTIKDQLAANRAQAASLQLAMSPNLNTSLHHPQSSVSAPPSATIPHPPPNSSSSPSSKALPATQSKALAPQQMTESTKASLSYLQKELFTLYKARKLSYNTATTTDIITKALATTIAQVNVIGARAGCGNNALSFLVERVPQQVSKILDIALTKSINERTSSQTQVATKAKPATAPPSSSSPPVSQSPVARRDAVTRPSNNSLPAPLIGSYSTSTLASNATASSAHSSTASSAAPASASVPLSSFGNTQSMSKPGSVVPSSLQPSDLGLNDSKQVSASPLPRAPQPPVVPIASQSPLQQPSQTLPTEQSLTPQPSTQQSSLQAPPVQSIFTQQQQSPQRSPLEQSFSQKSSLPQSPAQKSPLPSISAQKSPPPQSTTQQVHAPQISPAQPSILKPPAASMSRPPSFKSSSIGRPAFGLQVGKPPTFGKGGALSRPPTFLSNKTAVQAAVSLEVKPIIPFKREAPGSFETKSDKVPRRTE